MSDKHPKRAKKRGPSDRDRWGVPREPAYTDEQRAAVAAVRKRVEGRLSGHRLEHVRGVAQTALWLAQRYDVDPFEAEVAALLHDWDKKLSPEELWQKAAACELEVPRDQRLTPLLHAWTAAATLPELFPDLPPAVFEAVGAHTVGAVDMAPLDMVVYCADMLEPGRKGPVFENLRAASATCSLPELFALCHRQSIAYLLVEGRYVYPGALEVWNAWYTSVPDRGE